MEGIMQKSKCIIFTGHSFGGAIASLSTLWLLSHLPSSLSVLCITFGSPMLGNDSLSRAILQQRWGGNFINVVAQCDIVPPLLFAPLVPHTQHLHHLFHFWHVSMISSCIPPDLAAYLPEDKINDVFEIVLASLEFLSEAKEQEGSRFWPFGSYLFCSSDGAICLDHPVAVLKMLYVKLKTSSSPTSCVVDHVSYEKYVGIIHRQFLMRSSFPRSDLVESNYEAGVTLALQSSGIPSHDVLSGMAKDSLEMVKQARRRNLNSAKLTVELCKTKTLRVQIEWYKAFCDESDSQLGYYDSFKVRGASRRASRVNMIRIKLALFWDKVINMWETNQLPYDFHKQERWYNGSQFYKLLVEPLDIAEYYRNRMHQKKGHYLVHGREKRYKVFDRWWQERDVDNGTPIMRNEFASLTQDTCFWARVEEAREWLDQITQEDNATKRYALFREINKFEQYAAELIRRKEVSKDALAKYSSYSQFVKDWRDIKSQMQLFPFQLE